MLEQRRQLLVGAAVLFCRATEERRKAAQWQANVSRSRQERGRPLQGVSPKVVKVVSFRYFLGASELAQGLLWDVSLRVFSHWR